MSELLHRSWDATHVCELHVNGDPGSSQQLVDPIHRHETGLRQAPVSQSNVYDLPVRNKPVHFEDCVWGQLKIVATDLGFLLPERGYKFDIVGDDSGRSFDSGVRSDTYLDDAAPP